MATLAGIALQYLFDVQRVSALYLGAVVVCAALYGVRYGLVGAVAGTVLFAFVFGDHPFHLALGARQDVLNLLVFVVGAWLAGSYAEEARRGRDALWQLSNAPTEAAGGPSVPAWRRELLRITLALLLATCAAAIAEISRRAFGVERVSAVYLAAVVASAVMLGARFAIVTAIAAVVGFDFLIIEPQYVLLLDSEQAAFNFLVFMIVGWSIGTYAEQTRYERQAVRRLFSAGRTFSATVEEADLRALLCDVLSAANSGRFVAIRDEVGATVVERGRSRLNPLGSRELAVDGRSYGVVTWDGRDPWGRMDGQQQRTIATLVDIGAAAIARARYAVESAKSDALAQTEHLRRAILASVSHDVRTPLAGILGSATSLLDYGDRHPAGVRRDLLHNIREQAQRLDRYVDDILGLSRVEAGTLRAEQELSILEPIVFEAWETVLQGAPTATADIQVSASAVVDPGLLRQALGNILDNATKHAGSTASIVVRSQRLKDRVELVISDDGPGPSGPVRESFRPFSRGPNARAAGMGLGLYIASSFVEAMRGSIRAGARADGQPGFEVVISLPVEMAP